MLLKMPLLTLTVMPMLMLVASVCLLARFAKRRTCVYSPEFCLMILACAIDCVGFLCGYWRTRDFLIPAITIIRLLACEESVRNSHVLADNEYRSSRYWMCVVAGVLMGALSVGMG